VKVFPTLLPVAAVALIRADGQVLLQRRPMAKAHGGLWEFPGGKVEPGETPAEAGARELAEELAITVTPASLAPLAFAADHALVILLYTCRAWHGEPRALDAEAIDWFAPPAISSLNMPPLDVPLARALADALKNPIP
jgi:8-oxo-dGTP diphosphatase